MSSHINRTETDFSLSDAELMRYSRQILLESWDIDAQQRLKRSTVIILGAGGLGCPVSETLARAGVGRIHLIDNDVIEASNLQRQTLFLAKDIGQYKAEVACHTLQQINEFIQVSYSTQRVESDNAEMVLTAQITDPKQTLLLDCTDNFAVRELLNKVSVQHKLPLLSASAIAMSGQLALYEPSQQTGCYHCVFGATFATETEANDAEMRTCANSGVLASTTTVMGNLQANAALQYLGRGENPLAGQLLTWDGRSMTQHKLRYRQDKQCPVCAV